MGTMKILPILLLSVALTGCLERSKATLVETKTINAEVIRLDRPKHFYLKVRDVVTGKTYSHSSKHCGGWRKYSVGKVQPFVLDIYDVERSKVMTRVERLRGICG